MLTSANMHKILHNHVPIICPVELQFFLFSPFKSADSESEFVVLNSSLGNGAQPVALFLGGARHLQFLGNGWNLLLLSLRKD